MGLYGDEGTSLFCGLGSLSGGLLALEAGDEQGAGGVAGDVQGRTAHIEQLIDTRDDGDTFDGEADLRQNHRQHDHASAGDAGRADGGEGRGQNDHGHIAERQLHAVAAGDEDRADGLIDRGAVHVDRRAEGQDEGADLRLCTHLVAALDVDGERCVGGRGGEGSDHGRGNALEEGKGAHLGEELDGQAVDDHDVHDIAEVRNADDERQLTDDVRAVDSDDVGHQAEDTDRGELDDHHHDLHDDFFHAVDKLCDLLALLTGGQDARAEEDGDDDDRQHVGVDHGLEEVIGEDDDESDAIFMDIQDNLNDLIPVALEDEPEPEPVPVTKSTISSVLAESGVTEEQAAVIEQTYENVFGEEVPVAEHLVDPKLVEANAKRKEKLELVQQVENLKQQLEETRALPVGESDEDDVPAVKTYDVILRVKPEKVDQIHSQVIDGRKCLVIPMDEDEHAAVNGVNTTI